MHLSAHSHPHQFGTKFNPSNVAVTVLIVLLFFVFLLLFLTLIAGTAQAQNSVPPTARQAATMPQFASRLAHPASPQIASRAARPVQPRASYKHPLDPRTNRHSGPLDDNEIYDNGPINGSTDAWTINFGFVVSDTVPIGNNGSITGLTFGAWLFPGDVLQTVEVSITSAEFGGTTYFDQVVSFTQSGCSGNQYGFNVCTESGTFNLSSLDPGTYWVNLSNAVVNNGDPVYWDENSGPSSASENGVGTIPSEAFTVLGATCQYPPCPQCVESGLNFEILRSFTASEQSPAAGLAFDRAGRVYGTSSGGADGLGLAYQLAQFGQDWILNPLYSFLGGSSGQNPSPGIIGSDGAVYGTAAGGGDLCQGNQPCGEVYRLTPGPTACPSVLCSWAETVLYRFNALDDGFQPNGYLVFDRAGNLYGTTTMGGLYGIGTVYELTPSNGSWTETVLYNFNPATDYASPTTLLLGQDGNLYGATGYFGAGVIFQLVSSGGTWTENILSTAGGCNGTSGTCNLRLYQESEGSFFGTNFYQEQICHLGCVTATFAQIFQMSPSPGGWQFSTLADTSFFCHNPDVCFNPAYDLFWGLAVDPAGHVYGTEGYGEVSYLVGGDIFRVLQPGQRGVLEGFAGDDFRDIELRADGTLYGTTGACGNSLGTVWQLTPPPPEPKFHVLYNFPGGVDGAYPSTGLTMDAAGDLYGTTSRGGGGANNCTGGCGTVFKLSKQTSSWAFAPLYSFTGAPNGDGADPEARVTFGPNGVLYGTTQGGGAGQCSGGCGTVFSLQSESGRSRAGAGPWTETVIHQFQGASDGQYPWGQIAIDQAGNIYGVTFEGGPQGWGTAYQLAPVLGGWTFDLLHAFTGGADGGEPYGGVVLDSSGNVYGSAQIGGGPSGCGLVFQLAPSGGGWTENVVYVFPGSPACSPEGDLLRDNSGNLYGIAGPFSPGVAYMLTPSGQNWNYSQIYSFFHGQATYPGNLTMDAAGNLYGTSRLGGASQMGSVFELSPGPGGWTFISLHDFNGNEGSTPVGTVLIDANGTLYGTAEGGGAYSQGVVWQIVR